MPMSSINPGRTRTADLQVEQVVVDAAYEHLVRMRLKVERLLAEMTGADLDLEWALVVGPRRSGTRLGRLLRADGVASTGRPGISAGATSRTKWAKPTSSSGGPVALPFYRASWSGPMGLARRRQFIVDGQQILSIGDDTSGLAAPLDSTSGVGQALLSN